MCIPYQQHNSISLNTISPLLLLETFNCLFPHRITRQLSLAVIVYVNKSPCTKLVAQVNVRLVGKNGFAGILMENKFCSSKLHFLTDEIFPY